MAFVFGSYANAQNNKVGTWNILNAKYNFSKKWNAFGEAQLRSQELTNDFYYHELKAGVGYNVAPKTALLVAIGQYGTYNTVGNLKSPVTHEFRLWEQMTLTNDIGRVKLEHRYRVEQRFFESSFRNRFRYRLNGLLPINKDSITRGTLFLSVYDEIFLTDLQPYFERSRFFVGAGYVLSKLFTLQIGAIRQFDFSKTFVSSYKDYLQLSLLFEFKKNKSGRTHHPQVED
jgi:hypothetical protein